MANGEPMNSLSDAKAVLDQWHDFSGTAEFDTAAHDALAALVAEVELLTNEVSRLTAREARLRREVEALREHEVPDIMAHVWWANALDAVLALIDQQEAGE